MSGGEDGRTSGWLFLYARGRKRGYRILLAPDFLIEQEEHGWLGEQVGRATNPRPDSASSRRRAVCRSWRSYAVRTRRRRISA